MSSSVDERRRHRRYAYDGPVEYRRLGPATPGRIRNLSEGGLLVELPERFSSGTQLSLDLSLGDRSIHAEVEVTWSTDPRDGAMTSYPHGVKFIRLELQDRLSLAVFIAKVYGG
jgi:hypothetical protein